MEIITILSLLLGGLSIPSIVGLFFMWSVIREQKSPADTSNRINKIRLLWFAATREDKFNTKFPWMAHDEWENVNTRYEMKDGIWKRI